jgi:hypothetical protein
MGRDVLASGDASAIVDLTSRIASRAVVQTSAGDEDVPSGTPAVLPYRQATATAQRQ